MKPDLKTIWIMLLYNPLKRLARGSDSATGRTTSQIGKIISNNILENYSPVSPELRRNTISTVEQEIN